MLQDDLLHLESWADKWLMQPTPLKCNVMHTGRKSSIQTSRLNSVALPIVMEITDLGVCMQVTVSDEAMRHDRK